MAKEKINLFKKINFKLVSIILFIVLLFSVYSNFQKTLNKKNVKQSPEYTISSKTTYNYRTHIHNIDSIILEKKYDHFAVKDYLSDDQIEFIALKGNDSWNGPDSKVPFYIYKVLLNTKDKTIEENLIGEISNNYRSTDILITSKGKIFISYVSYDYRKYIALSVDQITLDNNEFIVKNIFKSDFVAPPYGPAEAGGKLLEYSDSEILIAIGNFFNDYLGLKEDSPFGKVVRLNFNNGEISNFSKGHRNPQGLTFSKYFNNIFETEHGPEGGDEINIIEQDKHYGWPHVTYGKNYGANPGSVLHDSSGGAHFGNHDGYQEPIYSYIPSIGIKAIEQMPIGQFEFPAWDNNFLICGKNGLFRVKFIKERNTFRLVFTENLFEFGGCRDIQILKNGKIIVNSAHGLRLIERTRNSRG